MLQNRAKYLDCCWDDTQVIPYRLLRPVGEHQRVLPNDLANVKEKTL